MKTLATYFLARTSLIVAVMMLASCAMPPKEAWRYIRRDGLIPYLAIEMGKRPVPSGAESQPNQFIATAPTEAPQKPVAPAVPVPVQPAAPVVQPKAEVVQSTPAAPARKLPVKPRLYLNNVPVDTAPPASKPKVASADEPEKASSPKPSVVMPKTEEPKKAGEPKKSEVSEAKPKPAPEKKPELPKTVPGSTESPAASKVAAKPDELPFGTPVPGRPGLVNSPYAGKMQLVDITGLKPGQEVKCPYTGKLFRVPPGAQASAKPAEGKKE